MPDVTVPLVLAAVQLMAFIGVCIGMGYAWTLRRDAGRHLADARKLHAETAQLHARVEQALTSARRAGVDLDEYLDA